MKDAVLCVRHLPHYRHDAFKRGLERIGYRVLPVPEIRPRPGDLLVIWNRQPTHELLAKRFEAAGATVIVTENGYVGADDSGQHLFALALNHHNGAGRWPDGGPERWQVLGIELAPWRPLGANVAVLAQRGIGELGVAMPRSWPADIERRLRAASKWPVKMRLHPGNAGAGRPLTEDLHDCRCAVTWGSSAALKALVVGVRVVAELPKWIGAAACGGTVAEPACGDRETMFKRLAWAQWSAAELGSGEPFKRLLELKGD